MSAAPQIQPSLTDAAKAPRTFLNHVPRWIQQHPAVLEPPAGRKIKASTCDHLLHVMAAAGERDAEGHITRIIGGEQLARKAGLAKRTFNRYIAYLHEHNLIVVLSRGGVVGRGSDRPFNAANIYGLPATAGGLDQRRVHRRAQVMKPTGERDSRGRPAYAPDVTVPGANATLWPQPEQPDPATAGYPAPGTIAPPPTPPARDSGEHGGGGGTLPPCPEDTTPNVPRTHPHPHKSIPSRDGHGGSRRRRGDGARRSSGPSRRKRPRMPHVDLQDLKRLDRLLQLHAACVGRGVIAGDRHHRLLFVAAAQSALRTQRNDPGADACAIFAEAVRRQRWLYISTSDEAEAQRMLAVFDRRAAAGRVEHAPSPQPEPKPTKSGRLTPAVAAALFEAAMRTAPDRTAAELAARARARRECGSTNAEWAAAFAESNLACAESKLASEQSKERQLA